jgi:3-oxosteroid 1-dehydrogenase|tara:strand:- start:7162 stop:8790 length:1629 start_codon:yes stop_codon:yes gene_type:complete
MNKAEYDVVVVGSGAAGLSSALAARSAGARVLVIEKAEVLGGTTAMSGGCIWAPGHHYIAQQGVTDNRESVLQYIRSVSPEGWHNTDEALWTAFVDTVPKVLHFLEEFSPLRFIPNNDPDPYAESIGGMAKGRNVSARPLPLNILGGWADLVRKPTSSIWLTYEEIIDNHFFSNPKKWALKYAPRLFWRSLRKIRTRGNSLTIGLLKGCLDAGIEVRIKSPARKLILTDGSVTGIEIERDGIPERVIVTSGVVLASGGFEWDPEMMARYFPGPVEWTASPSTNTGDGQKMALEAGAHLDRMDQALIMGTTPVKYEGKLQGQPAADYFLPHSMIVNRDGRRFVNEKQMNIGLAFNERDKETGIPVNLPAWRIYDSQFAKKYPHALPNKKIKNNFYQAGSLQELGKLIGVDSENLADTASRFTEFARRGEDEDFGRGKSIWDNNRGSDPNNKPNPTLGPIDQAPFFAMPFKASFLGTKGGPRTDETAQVLRPDGSIIEGLYAAGNVMANCFGSKGVGAGTTLGPCLTWGYIAGMSAATNKIKGE